MPSTASPNLGRGAERPCFVERRLDYFIKYLIPSVKKFATIEPPIETISFNNLLIVLSSALFLISSKVRPI
jgi:hypothetical protein